MNNMYKTNKKRQACCYYLNKNTCAYCNYHDDAHTVRLSNHVLYMYLQNLRTVKKHLRYIIIPVLEIIQSITVIPVYSWRENSVTFSILL